MVSRPDRAAPEPFTPRDSYFRALREIVRNQPVARQELYRAWHDLLPRDYYNNNF